jgi:hypothetical protein
MDGVTRSIDEFGVARFLVVKREKYTKRTQNIPNGHKIYQTLSISRPSIIYPKVGTIWQPWMM